MPVNSFNWFESKTGINIINLLTFYNINTYNLKSSRNILNLNFKLYNKLKLQYKETNKFIKLYSSKTLKELYKLKAEFPQIDFNSKELIIVIRYFHKIRNRLIREKLLFTNYKSLEEFDLIFNEFKNELDTKYTINKENDYKILEISQDDYLNKYYNIIKIKLQKKYKS